jgi:inorganic pyrophosphatase
MSVNHIDDIEQLPPHNLVEMRRFFEDYKKAEQKEVTVEKFLPKSEAHRIIKEAIDMYERKFKGKP